MELVEVKKGEKGEETQEAEYWDKKVKEKEEQRDLFFKDRKELLPPSKLKELEREELLSPQKQSLQQNKAALEGNQALKFMLSKNGR